MATVIHRMLTPGMTTGAVTGDAHRFGFGDEIEAEEGEFAHLRKGSYETRPVDVAEDSAPKAPAEDSAPKAPAKK